MSLHTITQSWLSTRPRITIEGHSILIAQTPALHWLCLGGVARRTLIDPIEKRFHLSTRTWPLGSWKTETFAFSDLSHIDYDFASLATDFAALPGHFIATDQYESFTVYACEPEGRRHLLARFHGLGAVETGWIGALALDDEWVDFAGTQESESAVLVRVLCKMTGLPLVKPLKLDGFTHACPNCQRTILLSAARCTYCAAVLPRTESRQPSAAATPVQADPALIPELRQTCVHCGRGIGKNSKRCIHCGNFVNQG